MVCGVVFGCGCVHSWCVGLEDVGQQHVPVTTTVINSDVEVSCYWAYCVRWPLPTSLPQNSVDPCLRHFYERALISPYFSLSLSLSTLDSHNKDSDWAIPHVPRLSTNVTTWEKCSCIWNTLGTRDEEFCMGVGDSVWERGVIRGREELCSYTRLTFLVKTSHCIQ